MFLFGTCFFEHGFLALVVCKMFFITAKIIINYSYLLNLNFLQWKCFSTYDWAAPSGASACRPYCYNTMRLDGDLKECGTVYEGRWSQGSSTNGSFRFKISEDGMEIRGPWYSSQDVFGNVRSGMWVARRLLKNGKVAKSVVRHPDWLSRWRQGIPCCKHVAQW